MNPLLRLSNKGRMSVAGLVVSAAAIVGICTHEGYRGEAYKDQGGVPTIGFGETRGVKMGQKTTPERALVQALKSTNEFAAGVRKLVKVPLYQYEFDAYVDFAYNAGLGNFAKSTMLKKLNAGDYEGACKELHNWVYVKGVKSKGLVNRRNYEYKMCIGEGYE